jgi:hypothetical protein
MLIKYVYQWKVMPVTELDIDANVRSTLFMVPHVTCFDHLAKE